MPRVLSRSPVFSLVASTLLLAACQGEQASTGGSPDDELTAIEARLASGGDHAALCVEYLGLCEQGTTMCEQGTNAQTYQSFCSGLQNRCRTTAARYCPQTDAGVPTDSGTTAGPAISAVSAFDVTQSEAKIRWTLNEPGTGQVDYGTTTSYGQTSTKETSFHYSAHTQQLSGLTAGTQYHFRVRSSNQAGGESVSGDFTFTTAGGPAPTSCAPAPTSPIVVNVTTYGATPDDTTDDTAAINRAIAAVPAGGTVLVPDGTYMINALTSVKPKSNMTLRMTNGATLKAITNSSEGYAIINVINGVSNVNIIGGKVQGERMTHTGARCPLPRNGLCGESSVPGDTMGMKGQWGEGINLGGPASHVVIEGVTATDNWGDGFTLGTDPGEVTDVTVCNVHASNNRRQGMSIVRANGVVVKDSIFENTHGTFPEAGIDVEPDAGFGVNNVQILNSTMKGNAGVGLSLYRPSDPNSFLTNVTADGNTIEGNLRGAGIVVITTGAHRFTNNIIRNNVYGGMILDQTSNSVISGNTITNNETVGIAFRAMATGNTVTGNTITGQKTAVIDLNGHNIIR